MGYGKSKKMKMGNPDKGHSCSSGHEAGSGFLSQQRGNEYNKIQDKIDAKCEKMLESQKYNRY